MKPWTPDIDPRTIPDEVLRSERGRRNNGKVIKRSGPASATVWAKHKPDAARGCRCRKCNRKRGQQ